jgi:hypothetical protein
MRLLKALSALSQKIDEKIGWSWIGLGLSIAMIGVAIFVLCGILRNVDIHRLIDSIEAIPPRSMAFTCLFVVAGYFTLTFYDYFALHSIGRSDVPYPTAALASFTSYTIGHNLGATVFTAAAVRLRIYSAWSIGILEVAKIAFITGLTFWLGNVFVLSACLVLAPDAASAVTSLAASTNRWLGLIGLLAIAGYVVWLLPRPRVIGSAGWRITLPDAKLTFVQIAIGIFDFAAGSLAFYMLMPASPTTSMAVVAVVFVSATLLGFISHAPGSLGIFDAAMLISLPQFETEALLASLLVFRLLYFLMPFVVAVTLLGARELVLAQRTRSRLQAERNAAAV